MSNPYVTITEIESAVRRYWQVLMEKVVGEMAAFYSYDAMVFNPFSSRAEPGRVSAARKERQFFSPMTSFRAEIIGPIDVQLLSDHIATASYNFRWHASNMKQEVLDKRFDRTVRDGRATQVFMRSPEGELHIVNEHLSDVWRDQDCPVTTGAAYALSSR
jgi:hypothetical protein